MNISFRICDLGSGTDEEGGGSLGGGLWLMNRFTVDIEDAQVDYQVALVVAARDGRLVAEAVTLTARPDGPAVTSTGLRTVTVDAYLAEVRRQLQSLGGGFRIMRRQENGEFTSWGGVGTDDWGRFDERQRRRRPSGELLPQVATLYRSALESLDPGVADAPTDHIAKTLHYSRGHVSRLLTQAREAGLLGPAPKGRAGESPIPKEDQ